MDALPNLPPRPADGHKGTFGTVGVVGGCATGEQARMIGAPALAATAAGRAGAGLTRVAAPGAVLDAVLTLTPTSTGIAIPCDAAGGIVAHDAAAILDALVTSCDALVVGPGLGRGAGVNALVVRAVGQEECPVVLDADGLNALAAMPDFARDIRGRIVMTPHPGEFKRLAGPLKIDDDPTDNASRLRACERLAQALGCVVVLKGSATVVSDGQRTWACERGHPCLATGGTGDVLAGVIAGLIAQFAPAPAIAPGISMPHDPKRPFDLYECARVGVQAHAIAGEHWADSRHASAGLLATELAGEIPAVLETMRGV